MNSLTNAGERACLVGPGIAAAAVAVRLYTAASVPRKNGVQGVDFVQMPAGNGYATGGKTISVADWTYSVVDGAGRITLADQTWTVGPGSIANWAGQYLVNAGGEVLLWWERPPSTVLPGGVPLSLVGLVVG